jgi:hypothetical protein
MRTRASVCTRKARFAAEADALAAARQSGLDLRPYRCDRCRQYHLTSRTKGKRRPIPLDPAAPGEESLRP